MTVANRLLRFGVVGLGHGSQGVIRELAQHPNVKVAAAADLRSEARVQFERQFGGETFSSVEDLCKSQAVDAVYIMTPNHLHAEHAVIAADHKKQIITTKPMALTLANCDAMIDAAERNGVRLLAGTTPAFTAPIQEMAGIVASGRLGKLLMINTWHFIEWLYRPRMQDELDPTRGGGVVFRQGTHQADILRTIGGGMVRSVRGKTTIADPARPVEGSYTCHLEFEDGASATMVFSGYAHYDDSDLNYGIGEGGRQRDPGTNLNARAHIRSFIRPQDEWSYKNGFRFGGGNNAEDPIYGPTGYGAAVERAQQFFGITLVSCERGDIRQTPQGLKVFGNEEVTEVPLPKPTAPFRRQEIDLLYEAWINDTPLAAHDGRWGKATLEVCLALLQSSMERQEVTLKHQVPYRTQWHSAG